MFAAWPDCLFSPEAAVVTEPPIIDHRLPPFPILKSVVQRYSMDSAHVRATSINTISGTPTLTKSRNR